MSRFDFEVIFTGRDDPRDGCIIIGEDERPVFFEFDSALLSPPLMRTTVRCVSSGVPEPRRNREGHRWANASFFFQICSDGAPVAAFDWGASGDSFGVATIGDREILMEHLVLPGSCPK